MPLRAIALFFSLLLLTPCKDSESYFTNCMLLLYSEQQCARMESIMAKTPEIQIPEVSTAEVTIESLQGIHGMPTDLVPQF